MFKIEGIIDYVMPDGCRSWKSEKHRSLAIKIGLNNKFITSLQKLKSLCILINSYSCEDLEKEINFLKERQFISKNWGKF